MRDFEALEAFYLGKRAGAEPEAGGRVPAAGAARDSRRRLARAGAGQTRARVACLAAVAAITAACGEPDAGTDVPIAVNFVAIDDRLHTAGQPGEAALAGLGSRGYDLVVNLAPPSVSIASEGDILAASGVRYVNIPVDWRNPTMEDFATFSQSLAASGDGRVLVHCQMNMRASMFTFLHRVTHDGVDPDEAFEFVQAVWTPNEQWAELGRRVLSTHGIDFDFPPAP
jgi:protein tyrosine phosphatase (PTP) superfamily phosphohydrolase (DUF442 family)